MSVGSQNARADKLDPVGLSRFTRGMSITLSIVVFAVLCYEYPHTDFKELGMWLTVVLVGSIPLVYGFVAKERQKELHWHLLPWFALGLVFLIVTLVDTRARLLREELQRTLVELDDGDQTENQNVESPDQLNSRALRYHEQRRLDDASYLYREVLEKREPKRPTQEQKQLAERFLPRLYTTEKEPFALKDLVVVIHPTKRLIGYHLVWEDDIDFLIDNDPGDHEIVWIQYDEAQERVEQVWAYWHGKFLQTKEAVEDANRQDAGVDVFVQWGKHGSLLKGWRKIIKIDGDKNVEEYEPLQFSRLSRSTRLARGKDRAKGYYAEQYPRYFDGTKEAFIDFTNTVDLRERLLERPMIAVSEYANAVIDQWFLPYNIYPKPDWPD